ncbi:phosphatase PAP2 family protein [Spongisporangium articulatum]|uniref:Phosphatase PAP2 family protein n=1 Tax=Spongisporangium articulatum TaxID=3362603 RepID=A0ABW8ASA3_9ACTN
MLLKPSWQLSATLTVLLVGAWLTLTLLRRAPGWRAFAREFSIVTGLLGLWQYVGRLVRTRSEGAFRRAHGIEDLQARLHLPSELSLQHAVLGHPLLVQAMNVYYATAHLNGMGLFLLWVWWMHRRRERVGDETAFRRVRNTVAATTLICLLVQMVPVAPPRLLPGYVDTALEYGQSVYGTYNDGLAAQLTAMPSVHVAWAFIVAWYVAEFAPRRWKWVGALHLVLTVLVVAATANHWWMDGIVAIGITGGVLAVQYGVRRLQRYQKSSGSRPALNPAASTMSTATSNSAPTR